MTEIAKRLQRRTYRNGPTGWAASSLAAEVAFWQPKEQHPIGDR